MDYGVYLGDFKDKQDVFNQFDCAPNGVRILLAWYCCANYEGSAFVLFMKDNKLYEVNGSHCSCYGLEGQWKPEETNIQALRYRMAVGHLGHPYDCDDFSKELEEALKNIECY
jgi:hypothetical protein